MSAQPLPDEAAVNPWPARRARAEQLEERYPFAAEVLTLFTALVAVQEETWRNVREGASTPAGLAAWAAASVAPSVVEATVAAGPAALGAAARSRLAAGTIEDALGGWLAGAELEPVERYLARSSLAPALEALGERAAAACATAPADGSAHCPRCGGAPQLSLVADSGDALVTGRRSLLCSRCSWAWDFKRSACPACGEADEARIFVYTERWTAPVSGHADGNGDGATTAVFPNLRIVGCETCSGYLIEVDLARDARAVPEVDELAAIPLDLYAAERGLTKVTPNLMGF